MHKDFVPPVSIEEFAAYLDGNLTEDGMNEVASAIQSDGFLQNVMSSCHTVDETVSAYEPLQLTVPEEISSTDFEIPQVDVDDYLNIGDWADLDVAACVIDPINGEPASSEDDISYINDNTGLDDSLSDMASNHLKIDWNDAAADGELTDIDNTDYNDL